MSDLVDPAPEQTGGHPAAEATGVEVIDAEDRVRPTGLFVAGVGRSGTSIATRLAMSLGLRGPQPEDVMPANAANPTGYWESNSLAILNDDLLGRVGATWWTPPAELSDADLARLAPKGAAAAQAFEAAFGPGPGWVWKDPRLTVLLRFWSKILGDQPILLPTRSPQAVARSISARDGIPYESALDVWDRHTRCLLTSLMGRRVLVVQYESLLEDPQAWVHDVYDFARSSGLPVAEMDGLPELVAPSPQEDASLQPAQQRLYDLVRDLTGVHASFPPLDLPPAGEAGGPPIDLDRVVAQSAPQSASAQLSARAAGLAEEQEMIRADHDRIVAERSVLVAELDRAHEQLRDADVALREVMGQRDDALQAVAELDTRVQALTLQLDHQRSVAVNAARERDEYGMRLLDAEQKAAFIPRDSDAVDPRTLRERLDKAAERLLQLENELSVIRRTVSWRVTRPLRSVRTLVSGRDAG